MGRLPTTLDARLRVLDYTTTDELADSYADETERILLTLDQAGRRIRDVVEALTGMDFDEALLEPARSVKTAISERLRSAITYQLKEDGYCEPEVNVSIVRMRTDFDALRYPVDGEVFEMTGTFDADSSGCASVDTADGSGLDLVEAEPPVTGRSPSSSGLSRGHLSRTTLSTSLARGPGTDDEPDAEPPPHARAVIGPRVNACEFPVRTAR